MASHQPGNFDELVVGRAVPWWSCANRDMGEMAAHVTQLLPNLRPTLRAQKYGARDNNCKLTAARPADGTRFRVHVAHSEISYLTGCGAAASAAVRMPSGVGTELEDARARRGASRAPGASASDVNRQWSGGTTAAIPDRLKNIDLDGLSSWPPVRRRCTRRPSTPLARGGATGVETERPSFVNGVCRRRKLFSEAQTCTSESRGSRLRQRHSCT